MDDNVVKNINVPEQELSEVYDDYAQRCVDDMDIDDLMNTAKTFITERLEGLYDSEAMSEIKESVYAADVLRKFVL